MRIPDRHVLTVLSLLALPIATARLAAQDGDQRSAQDGGLRPGLVGEYFRVRGNVKEDRVPEAKKPFFVNVDAQIDFASTDGVFNGSKLMDNLLVRWTGLLRIVKPGGYRFATNSDDGSRLYVDERLVVDNWGPHSMEKKSGTIDLVAGDHAIRVMFNEGGGGAGCIAAWTVPGGAEVPIPKSALFHSPAAAKSARARWNREKWLKAKKPRSRNAGRTYPKHAGPVIETAVNLGKDARGTNTVYRGIVVRLDADGKACTLFDADTLRMASAWTDNSLVLIGLPFTAGHGTYPRVKGKQVFRLRATPGWARGSEAMDPRHGEYPPLGHLPKDWAHYKGLYMSGDRVVLEYTVGRSKVLESPSLVQDETGAAIARTFEIERDGSAMTLVLMDATNAVTSDGTVAIVGTVTSGGATDGTVTSGGATDGTVTPGGVAAGTVTPDEVAAGTVTPDEVTAVGVAPKTAGRLESRGGSLVLDLPASGGTTRFTVSYARVKAGGDEVHKLVTTHPSVDFAKLRRGGATRWPATFKTKGEMARKKDERKKAFVVDRITVPFKNEYEPRMRIGGVDFFSDGRTAAVSTWDGDVWIVKGIEGDLSNVEWKRFATGLHEPLGLTIVDDVVYTVDDMQITRLHDLDKNGEADYYENFNNDWQLTSGFHAFCFDLHAGPDGDFFFAFGSPVRSGGRSFERMGDHHGSIIHVSKDGAKMERYATGLRAPNGIGVGPQGQVTSGDNEGTFVPRCPIHWISKGEFLGVVDSAPLSLRDKLETTASRKERVPGGRARHVDASEMPQPMVWLPRRIDNSGGGQVWVTSDEWGPLKGRLLHMSYGQSSLYLVLPDDKGTVMQGGVVKIPVKFSSSAMRGRFNPRDGQLYVAGLKGWQTNAVRDAGFDRVRFTGKPLALPIGLRTNAKGVEITFSDELDPELANDAESFEIRAADILWTQAYGTKEYELGQRGKKGELEAGWTDLAVKSAKLSAGGKRVFVEIPEMQVAHEMEIAIDVETTGGAKIRTKVYCTVHTLQ